jgi:hypothetical protein
MTVAFSVTGRLEVSMKKRIIFLTILITLVCLATFGLVACNNVTPIIIRPGDDPGKGAVPVVETLDTSDFFAFMQYVVQFAGDSLSPDEDGDYLVFSFQSEKIDLTVDEVTKGYYINFKAKYNRTDDSKSDILFELRDSVEDGIVLGFYYDAGKFYLDIAGNDGPNLLIKEVNLQQIVQLASSATGSLGGIVDMIDTLEFGGLNIGSMVSGVLSDLIKTATLTTTGTAKELYVETDISAFVAGMFNILKTVAPIIPSFLGINLDDILYPVFGLRLANIVSYPLDKTVLEFNIKTIDGVFSEMSLDASYGIGVFGLGMQIGADYYGTDIYAMPDIVFPSFEDNDTFSELNYDVEFNLVYDNRRYYRRNTCVAFRS